MNSNNPAADIEEDDGVNGLYINGVYLSEDVLIVLLSHVESKQLLNCKLVCKLWNRIIKSRVLWHEICIRKSMKPKCLPWYLYYAKFATDFFDTNLIKNGNGQEKYEHWVIKPGYCGAGFLIEDEPNGAPPLPVDVEDFNGHKSCYATSFGLCSKQQIFKFKKCSLRKHILDKYKPKMVASEWFAQRFDCPSWFNLIIKVQPVNDKIHTYLHHGALGQWPQGVWEKFSIEIADYPSDVDYIVYQHEGQDQPYWEGHFGIKMAGASLKIVFDSIEAVQTDESPE